MPSILFYTICIGFASGILFRSLFDFGVSEIGLVLVVSLACVCLWRRKAYGFATPLLLTSLFLFVCALGMFRMDMQVSETSLLSNYVGESVELRGVIKREPEARADTVHLHVAPYIQEETANEYVLVTLDRFSFHEIGLEYGDVVRVHGELTYPESFDTDTGRIFDYPNYLASRNIKTVLYGGEVALETKAEVSFIGMLLSGKSKFMDSLESYLPQPHASLGEGILLGVKKALSEQLDEAFRETGTIHIVVLSGYNVLIVVEAMLYMLAYVCKPRMRMVIGLLGIATFALLVGMSATVIRACIMASLLLIARGTGRVHAVLRALALAGILMLSVNPYLLVYDPGFQLSFLATLGLILFSPYIESVLKQVPEYLGIRGIITATIATQIAVLPILLYHTGMLSAVSLVANALVLPMVPVAMFLTFVTGIFGVVSATLGHLLGYTAYLSLTYIIEVVYALASLPFSAYTVHAFPFWMVLGMYVGIAFWYGGYMRKVNHFTIQEEKISGTDAYEGWVIEGEKNIQEKAKLPFR